MGHKVESDNNRELVIRTDKNKLVKFRLVRPNEHYGLLDMVINDYGKDIVIYSELLDGEWVDYPTFNAVILLNVVNPFGVQIEYLTIDCHLCNYFQHWYTNKIKD